MKPLVLAPLLAALLVGGPAMAQRESSAASLQSLGGPLIPGLCLLSRDAMLANSAVGKAMTARLAQLAQEAQAEIDVDRKPVEAELRAFQAAAPKLTPAQRSQREQALQPRVKAVQDKTQLRSREMDATRAKAMAQVSTYMQPAIASAYAQRKCGLVIDRNAVVGGNMGNDLTSAVIKALDAKVTTISFNRESLAGPSAAPTRR